MDSSGLVLMTSFHTWSESYIGKSIMLTCVNWALGVWFSWASRSEITCLTNFLVYSHVIFHMHYVLGTFPTLKHLSFSTFAMRKCSTCALYLVITYLTWIWGGSFHCLCHMKPFTCPKCANSSLKSDSLLLSLHHLVVVRICTLLKKLNSFLPHECGYFTVFMWFSSHCRVNFHKDMAISVCSS